MNRALLIGINYINCPPNTLNGCWNDAYNIHRFLSSKGMKPSQIRLMTDEGGNKGTPNWPTAENIKIAMTSFIASGVVGDKLIFSYSGHGGLLPNKNGQELSGFDECIYGCDLEKIIDDDLRKILIDSLKEGVQLRCVLDCCHSGTGLDLPYLYTIPEGLIKEEKNLPLGDRDVVCISACLDIETAADAYINKTYQGALTSHLLQAMKNKKLPDQWRWCDFLTVLKYHVIKDGYKQTPQISFFSENAHIKNFDFV